MFFNSFVFPIFFAFVYASYLLLRRNQRMQNLLLLVASYFFYGWWDWRFLFLLAISTIVDFSVGRALARTEDEDRRRRLVTLSLVSNLSILGFFKYFNFFTDSLVELLASVGFAADPFTLQIVLPVGISFYTFQTLSYTIDVYRKRLKATSSLLDFALFVAFFPQLVAGPIERARNLLPQIAAAREVTAERVNVGLFLILWGYFKKVFIADRSAIVANQIFNNYTSYDGIDLVIGTLAFTLQIYGDFSGYSDIARGLSKLLGFDLMVNFKLPYFARNPSEFWERWHISLSSWLRDYLYIPLGGNRGGSLLTQRNLMITMLLGGLWHGAAWNFLAWGAYHGAILGIYRLIGARPDPPDSRASHLAQIVVMFILVMIGWILFRCESLDQIIYFMTHLGIAASDRSVGFALRVLACAAPILAMQLFQHKSRNLLVVLQLPMLAQILFYAGLVLTMLLLGVRQSSEFIYFQF